MTLHRSLVGSGLIPPALAFFLQDPKKYWWLSILIAFGLVLIADDVLYYSSGGKWCILCSIIPPGRQLGEKE